MDEIKMKGRLVYFDKADGCYAGKIIFPKTCDLTYPEMLPVVWNFDFNNPDNVCGKAVISKDEQGLVCDVTITKNELIELLPELNNEIGIGGYYTRLKDYHDNGNRIIYSAMLRGIGLTLGPVNEDYKLVLVKEE